MKAFIFLFVLSACVSLNHAVENEISYVRKNNVSYFIHSASKEAVFIQHDKDQYKLSSSENIQVSYDFAQKKVTVLHEDGKQVVFTTDPELAASSSSAFLVLGIGHTYYDDEAVQDDGTIALDCGCFTNGNHPTVNGQPAECANNNPELSTGCSVSSGLSGGASFLGAGGNAGQSSGCSVTCGGGSYSCCINSGTFDN